MHWCNEENVMVMSMIPFIGYYFNKFRNWYHLKFGYKCHEKTCNDNHVEHE